MAAKPTFAYGDIVKCISDTRTSTGPLKVGGLYVVEAVAAHKKSIRVAGDWHAVGRFEVIGKSDLGSDPNAKAYKDWDVNFEQLEAAAGNLIAAFTWDKSDEGDLFWNDVYGKLCDYVEKFRPYAEKA